jgi:signal transduction histidine kinase
MSQRDRRGAPAGWPLRDRWRWGRGWSVSAGLLLVLTQIAWAQRASPWRSFKMADGMPESGCIALTVSPQGKVLVRQLHQPLVTQLDGYSIHSSPAPALGRSRIYQSPGGQFWTVSAEGLEEFDGGRWLLHPIPELMSARQAGFGQLVDPAPLCVVRQGQVLMLLPDRLLEFSAQNAAAGHSRVLQWASATRLERFWGMTPARDGGLWISGERGLAKVPGPLRLIQPGAPWIEHLLPKDCNVHALTTPHEDYEGGIVALGETATNGQKVIALFDGQDWEFLAAGSERLRQAWSGPEHGRWAMTLDSLFEWEPARRELVADEDISPRQFFDLALEPGGAFWLATSDGLYRYAPLLWRIPQALRQLNSLVHCLAGDSENRLWFVAGSSVHLLQDGLLRDYPLPGGINGRFQPRALYLLKGGVVVLAARFTEPARGERLFQFQPAKGAFTPLPSPGPGRKTVALGVLRDGSLCVQVLDPEGGSAMEWRAYDGYAFAPLTDPPPGALLGTNLDLLFTAHNGDLWVSGELGTAWYHEKKWRPFLAADKSAPGGACAFAELTDGRLWCATREELWEFDGGNWAEVRRGFDRINQLQRTRDGSLWVASNGGLFRFFRGVWVENGIEEGLASTSVRELYEDQRGELWAATTRGLCCFHPEADPDPPHTTIDPLSEHGDSVPANTMLTVSFSAIDKWKFTPRDRLLYSYRRDEQDWSPFQEMTHIPLTDLPAGKHVFQVRAMDRNCNIEPKVQREFSIVLPWYKETRLVSIALAGLATALFFAGLAFNRHRQLLRSYAEVERKVAERTHQLELAHHELAQSQKMTALGTLAAGIAHDFNNILSIIKGSAQIIEDNLQNPEKVRLRTDRIKMVVEQGAGIVKEMLGFSRDTGQAPTECDLNTVVRDTLKLLGDRFLREVQVRFEPAPGLPRVWVSKDFIQQVLLNFLFNAAESMTRNPREVVITTSRMQTLPSDLVLVPAAADCLAVSVADVGCGITPENLPRIFEPFFTTKALSARRGTGLGLSMVYELARRMGAGLAVQSIVDQGSTFTLLVPVSPLPQPPSAQPGRPVQSPHPL